MPDYVEPDGESFEDYDPERHAILRYQSAGQVRSLAQHIGHVIDPEREEELQARAVVYLLDMANELPPPWRDQLEGLPVVPLAIALDMCSHPDNHTHEEVSPDPREHGA